MNRTLTALLAVAMVVGMAAPAVAVADPAATAATDAGSLVAEQTMAENETTNDSIAPGEMLAGSIGAHQAEIRGTVDQRAFGLQIAAAATNDSKAQVLDRVTQRLQERQQELEARQQTLQTARENGSISESQYRVRSTRMAAEASTLRTMANDSERVAQHLPRETLESNGVNVTAMQRIREHAESMTGPETARIARHIAGNDVGQSMGPPENVPGMAGEPMGPPEEGAGTTDGPMGPPNNDSGTGSMGSGPGGPSQGQHSGSPMTTTATTSDDSTTDDG